MKVETALTTPLMCEGLTATNDHSSGQPPKNNLSSFSLHLRTDEALLIMAVKDLSDWFLCQTFLADSTHLDQDVRVPGLSSALQELKKHWIPSTDKSVKTILQT